MEIGDRIPLDEKLEELFDEVRTASVVYHETLQHAADMYHKTHRSAWDYIYTKYPELRTFSVSLDQNARELVIAGPATPDGPA